jgi:hypothetical protein
VALVDEACEPDPLNARRRSTLACPPASISGRLGWGRVGVCRRRYDPRCLDRSESASASTCSPAMSPSPTPLGSPGRFTSQGRQKLARVRGHRDESEWPDRYGNRPEEPNFAAMAEAAGIKGIRVEHSDQVERALREAFAHPGFRPRRRDDDEARARHAPPRSRPSKPRGSASSC